MHICWHLQPFWHQLRLHSSFNRLSYPTASQGMKMSHLNQLWPFGQACPIHPNRMQNNTFRRPGTERLRQTICHYSSLEPLDNARLHAASAPHSGDWLHAPPTTAVGLRLSDEAVRVAVAHRLGCKPVDARGLHGLSCRKSAPRQQRHSHLNDIVWRAIKRAQIPAVNQSINHVFNVS